MNYIYWFQLTITIFLKKGNCEFLRVIWKILGKQPLLGKGKSGSVPFLVVFCVFLAAGGASEEIPALLGDPGGCTWVKEPCWGCHGSKGQMLITEVTFENYLLKIMWKATRVAFSIPLFESSCWPCLWENNYSWLRSGEVFCAKGKCL